jgi:hypothetical protein
LHLRSLSLQERSHSLQMRSPRQVWRAPLLFAVILLTSPGDSF